MDHRCLLRHVGTLPALMQLEREVHGPRAVKRYHTTQIVLYGLVVGRMLRPWIRSAAISRALGQSNPGIAAAQAHM